MLIRSGDLFSDLERDEKQELSPFNADPFAVLMEASRWCWTPAFYARVAGVAFGDVGLFGPE